MALDIIGLIHSLFTEWKKKRSTEEFAVEWLMKQIMKAGGENVLQANKQEKQGRKRSVLLDDCIGEV